MRWPSLSDATAALVAGALALVVATIVMVAGEGTSAPASVAARTSSPCNVFGVQPVTLTPTLPTRFSASTA